MFIIARITMPYGYPTYALPGEHDYGILPFGVGMIAEFIFYLITLGLIMLLAVNKLFTKRPKNE